MSWLTLTVPVEARYRALVPDIAAKYAELAGCPPADGQALGASLRTVLDQLAARVADTEDVELKFHITSDHVEIAARCHGHTKIVKQALPASKR